MIYLFDVKMIYRIYFWFLSSLFYLFIKSARCRKAGREQFQSKGLTFTLSVDINRKPLKFSNSAKMNPSWNSEVVILLIVGGIWIFSIWRFLRKSISYIIEATRPSGYKMPVTTSNVACYHVVKRFELCQVGSHVFRSDNYWRIKIQSHRQMLRFYF